MTHRAAVLSSNPFRAVRVHREARRRRRTRPVRPARPRERGLTLIELMTVLVIVGILLVSAVPNIAGYLARQRVTTASNDLLHAMIVTRTEALRRGRRVYIAPVDGHWHNGWTIFVDRNDNRLFDPAIDELIQQHDALPASVEVTNPANASRESFTDVGSPQRAYVLFEGNGYARQRNGGFAAGSVTVTDRSAGLISVRTLCLASLGRVRIVERHSCN